LLVTEHKEPFIIFLLLITSWFI